MPERPSPRSCAASWVRRNGLELNHVRKFEIRLMTSVPRITVGPTTAAQTAATLLLQRLISPAGRRLRAPLQEGVQVCFNIYITACISGNE